jgi:hypothetical protein
MMVKRMAAVAVVGLFLISVGCSSSKKQDAKATASSVLSGSTTTSGSGDSTTTKASSSGGTGNVAAFCAAFTSLSTLGSGGVNDKAAVASKLKDSAQQIRDNAPADLSESANAYADLLDTAADAINNADSAAAMGQAFSGVANARAAQNMVPMIKYAATTCTNN